MEVTNFIAFSATVENVSDANSLSMRYIKTKEYTKTVPYTKTDYK